MAVQTSKLFTFRCSGTLQRVTLNANNIAADHQHVAARYLLQTTTFLLFFFFDMRLPYAFHFTYLNTSYQTHVQHVFASW
jgi:hypothetical protein